MQPETQNEEEMSTTNNNFTVESLVAKYRNYVNENCSKEYFCDDYQDENGKWHTSEGYAPFSPDGDADEQLLVTLYKKVAGRNSDDNVLDALSKYADKFYSDALSDEELSFLCSNFEEAVAFSFSYLKERKGYLMYSIPFQMIDIIKQYATIEKGSSVFVADSRNGDIASLFTGCTIKGYTSHKELWYEDELWALVQIRLYAQGITSNILRSQEGCAEESYLKDVECAILGSSTISSYDDAEAIYKGLKPGALMIFFMDENDAAGIDNDTYSFRKLVAEDMSIKSIISYEYKDEWLSVVREKIVLLIEKTTHESVHVENGVTGESFDILSKTLDCEILWPSFYNTKCPESGVPFSSIVSFIDLKEREVIKNDGKWVLPEEIKHMPVAVPAKMAKEYKDANLLAQDLDLAGSPLFDDNWKFWIRSLKERCVLLYGNKEKTVVGYINNIPKTGIATLDSIVCLVPKDGLDVRYIAALLLTPEVKDQITSICQGAVNDHTFPLIINKVLVPNHSDKERLEFLSEANYEALESSQKELKKEHQNYTKAVRMRKHALTQSLSSIEVTFYALNEYRIRQNGCLKNTDVISRVQGTTVKDAFEFLSTEIKEMMPVLEHIADVEYSFAKPESIDPEEFMEDYIRKKEKSWLNFRPVVTWTVGDNKAKRDIKREENGPVVIAKGEPLNTIMFPKDALEKIFNNILSNAKAYAFTEDSRKDYQLRFSWYSDGVSLIIEIENNGTPIPEDRDTASLLEYGVSTSLHQHGHNGIGCNEIVDIMSRYDGEVKIISSPKEKYTVKYVLTFNNSYTYIQN